MKTKKIIGAVLVGAIALLSLQLAAARGNALSDYEPGFYLGLQLGGHSTSASEDNWSETESGGVARLLAGYSFTPYVSVESGYAYYHLGTYKDFFGTTVDVGLNSWDLMIKGIYPFGNGMSIYGKVGPSLNWASAEVKGYGGSARIESTSKVGISAGAGVAYNFTDQFALDLGYNFIAVDVLKINAVMLGISYKF